MIGSDSAPGRSGDSADTGAAHEGLFVESPQTFLQIARNPVFPRSMAQECLTVIAQMLAASDTDIERANGGVPLPMSRQELAELKSDIERVLVQRDAADRAEPRRMELRTRMEGALQAVDDCILGMQTIQDAARDAKALAEREGFLVSNDGCVRTPESNWPISEGRETIRARYEHHLMSLSGKATQLQNRTVTTMRERLGADQPGIPWTILELARSGYDTGELFTPASQLPESPLRDLACEIIAYAAQARARVWPDTPTTF